jgi:hypothetical protein
MKNGSAASDLQRKALIPDRAMKSETSAITARAQPRPPFGRSAHLRPTQTIKAAATRPGIEHVDDAADGHARVGDWLPITVQERLISLEHEPVVIDWPGEFGQAVLQC